MSAWLHVVGIGEDGLDGLTADARAAVETAEVLIGGDRHRDLGPAVSAERLAWPSPYDAMVETIRRYRGRRIAVLVAGDPLWFSVGARLSNPKYPNHIPAGEIVYHPQISAFQWTASRIGWSLADVETLTAHRRPPEEIIPYFWPGARLLILATGVETPGRIAALLSERGYGDSKLTVFSALGGVQETRQDGLAAEWREGASDFNTMAVEVIGAPERLLSRGPGLPDDAFLHDSAILPREIRVAILAALMPARGETLWEIDCGCAAMSVEWMRAAPDALAIGIEQRPDRIALALGNAQRLGAPRLRLVQGRAPEALDDLPPPNAVLIGGGLTFDLIRRCREALSGHGRLVAVARFLEEEAVLMAAQDELGGDLVRHSVMRSERVGARREWRSAPPVTHWSTIF